MMMKINKQILLTVFYCCLLLPAVAQSVINNGMVRYDRKVNLHKQMEGWSETWSEAMKKNSPKYDVSVYDLQFTTTTTSFKKSADQPPTDPRLRNSWMRDDNETNITFKDLATQQITAQKQVFEKVFLIKDSLQPIQWKITNEFKKIADKNCRKATTILMDSLFVIAYYTDDIICSSGPEGLHGLPGMILGAVIPRLNTSYFATIVTPYLEPTITAAPSKGSATTYKALLQKLDKSMDDWGKKWKVKTIWNLML